MVPQLDIMGNDINRELKAASWHFTGTSRRLSKQGNAVLPGRPLKRAQFHFLQDGVKRLLIEADLEDFTLFLVHLSLKNQHRRNRLNELYSLTCRPRVLV